MSHEITSDVVRAALSHIDADCDRDLWLRMAMSCKAELGEEGFDIWDSWSQGAGTYSERDARATWKSIDSSGRVTIATLLYEAKQRGFHLNGTSSRVERSAEEIESHRRERSQAKEQEAAEAAEREAKARIQAVAIWESSADEDGEHGYLAKKGVKAHGLKVYRGDLVIAGMACDGALIVPIKHGAEIHSLQFLNADGEKRYLADGRKSGNYFAIGTPQQVRDAGAIVVAEGYATAASIFESTGYPAVAAFDAGNLLNVAKTIRGKFTQPLSLIVAADNDRATICKRHRDEGATQALSPMEYRPQWCRCNPGITAGLEAARGVGGLVAVPEFSPTDDAGATDFNDLAALRGPDAITAAISAALSTPSEIPEAAPHGAEAVDTESQAASTDEEKPESLWPASMDLEALSEREPTEPAFIINDWGPTGYAWLLAGHGGVGKSGIALHLAVCMAAGLQFFGLDVERKRVCYLSCEDRERVLHWRLSRICRYLGITLASLRGQLEIIDLVGREVVFWERDPRDGSTLRAPYYELKARIEAQETEVFFVDGITDTYAGAGGSTTDVKRYVNALVNLIPPEQGAVVLIGHISKPSAQNNVITEGYSGPTTWHNSVRARWYLYPETKDDEGGRGSKTGELILELQKSNLGRTDQAIRFSWDEAAHLFVGRIESESTFDRKHQDREEQEGIMRALQACASTRPETIVPAAVSGPRTDYHVLGARSEFPESLQGRGTTGKKRFRRHVEVLRQQGRIIEATYQKHDRHTGTRLVCGSAGNA